MARECHPASKRICSVCSVLKRVLVIGTLFFLKNKNLTIHKMSPEKHTEILCIFTLLWLLIARTTTNNKVVAHSERFHLNGQKSHLELLAVVPFFYWEYWESLYSLRELYPIVRMKPDGYCLTYYSRICPVGKGTICF